MGEILFLAHRVPFPPNRGDKIRAHHLLKKLAQIGPVHVGCLAENAEDRKAIEGIASLAKSYCVPDRRKPLVLAGAEAVLSNKPVSLTAFHSPRLDHWVKRVIASERIETIVVFSGQMGQYVPADFDGRVVIDLCDVDSAKFENYAENGDKVWINAREARLLAREEERLSLRSDATFLISENEAELFLSRVKQPAGANVQVMGNGIDAEFFDPRAVAAHPDLASSKGPHLVFTGQMDYLPNEQAALWVIDHLMPKLRQVAPLAQFHVVGRNPTVSLKARQGVSGATIWGEVPDVRPFIAGAGAILAPMAIARGVQNKVLEAMSMARPVVLTEQAATGIEALNGTHWMVTDLDPEAMCDGLNQLFSDPELAQRMGAAARDFVLANHAWDAMLEPLERSLLDREEARDAA